MFRAVSNIPFKSNVNFNLIYYNANTNAKPEHYEHEHEMSVYLQSIGYLT